MLGQVLDGGYPNLRFGHQGNNQASSVVGLWKS
jgi:hypothetical protein